MLKEILTKTYYANTVQDWLFSLLIIFGAVIAGKLLYWLSSNIFKKLAGRTQTKLDDIIVDMIEEPVIFAIVLTGIWFGLNNLLLNEAIELWTGNVQYVQLRNRT